MITHFSSVDLTRMPAPSGSRFAIINCPECGEYLSLHQPDVLLSDRKIATCEGCQSWYLLDCKSRRMLRLPDEATLRSL
jgi:hypothetical protein